MTADHDRRLRDRDTPTAPGIDLDGLEKRIGQEFDGELHLTAAEGSALIALARSAQPPAPRVEAEKHAPVQGWSEGIPWSMHLRAYEAYSKKWSPQPALVDLEGRNCRGGFSTRELDDFIPGWRDELSDFTAMKARTLAAEGRLAKAGELLNFFIRAIADGSLTDACGLHDEPYQSEGLLLVMRRAAELLASMQGGTK